MNNCLTSPSTWTKHAMCKIQQIYLLLVLHCLLERKLPLQGLLLLHLVIVELGKVVDDDGDGEGHHKDPRDRTAGADKHTRTWVSE